MWFLGTKCNLLQDMLFVKGDLAFSKWLSALSRSFHTFKRSMVLNEKARDRGEENLVIKAGISRAKEL